LKLFVSINIIQINNGQLRIAPRTLDIECTTNCLAEGTYYAVVTLMDNVGLERVLYAEIVLGLSVILMFVKIGQHHLTNV
jgi:hypothetical protein